MKKSLFFGFAALAALAFSACQKEATVNEKEMVTVTLTAQKPGDETRTAAVEEDSKVSYIWTDEDKANLKVFVVGEDAEGKETLTEVTDRIVAISSDNKVLTVTATVEAGSTLRTAVASAWTSSNKPKINVNQSPKTDNFDPGADVLVAEDVTVDGLDEALLDFSRPASMNKMTLKNLTAGEKIYEVTVTSDKDIAGYYENGVMKGQAKTLTLSYDNVEVGENGEFPVYFVTMPNEGNSLTVVVKSDQFVYTKSFGTVNFTVGKFSKFGVKLPAGEPVVSTDYTGDWVITGVNGGNAFAAQAYASGDNNLKALGVTLDVDNEKISSTKVNEIKMHLEKVTEGDYAGLYTILDASGNYLYAASSSANQMKGAATIGGADYYWAVEKETDGTFSIKATKSSNRNVMQFNSGSSVFSCYASASQKPVTLYPYSWVEEDADAPQPSGTGTLDDPYNALGAVDAVKDLTWTSNTDYESTDDVYVKGKISRIDNNGTYTGGGTYGNASFYISEDGNAVNEFYCFRVLYLGNKKYEAGQTDIKVGDDVVIYGKLMNYKGNTPETVGNAAYLYSLNGVTEEEPAEKFTITVNPSENGTVTASASEAVAGAEITLAVTPATGYELDALTVVDASSNTVAVSNNKFTMPESNVTVSATFKEKQQGGDTPTDYSEVYTSNVTLEKGTSAQDYTLTISGNDYSGVKAGASKNGGSMSFSIPSGTTRITLHAQGWGSDAPTVAIATTLGTVSPTSFNPNANSEYSGNGTSFTITTTSADYFVFDVTGVTSDATITLSTDSGKSRFVVWGVNVD